MEIICRTEEFTSLEPPYTFSDSSCKMWWPSISEIDSSVSSIRKQLSYRKHVHHKPGSKYALRCWEKRERLHVLQDNRFLKFERMELKAWKLSAERYDNQTMKFTCPAVGLPPFYPWVCLHHTFVVCKLIFRCLTGSHMTISSKSNYRVRLNVNINIADQEPITWSVQFPYWAYVTAF